MLEFPTKIDFSSLKIILALANGVDPDEMQHYAAFHLVWYSLFDKVLV